MSRFTVLAFIAVVIFSSALSYFLAAALGPIGSVVGIAIGLFMGLIVGTLCGQHDGGR